MSANVSPAHDGGGPAGGVLVVGIGNELLSDDGLGVHVARALAAARDALPAWVEVVEAGLALLDLAPQMSRCERVVIVDAVHAGSTPGTVYRLELGEDFAAELSTEPALSLHQWGVADTLRAIGLMGLLPPRLTVIGAEPARVELGLELSSECAEAARSIVAGLVAELGIGAVKEGGRAATIPIRAEQPLSGERT